jgi:putative membrane protein
MNRKLYLTIATLMLSATAVSASFQSQSQSQSQPSSQQSPQSKGQEKKGDTGTQKETNRSQTQRSEQQDRQNAARLNNSDRRFVNDAAESGMAEVIIGQLAVERASNDEVKRFAQRMIDDHTKANQELMQLATAKGITMPNAMMNQQADRQSGHRSDQHISTTQTQSGQAGQGSSQAGSQSTTDTQSTRQDATRRSPQSGTQTGQQNSQMSKSQNLQGKHRDQMNRLSKLSGAEFDREYMRHQLNDHEKAIALFQRQATEGSDAELKEFASRTLPALREHQQMARDIATKVGASDSKSGRNSGNTSQSRQN